MKSLQFLISISILIASTDKICHCFTSDRSGTSTTGKTSTNFETVSVKEIIHGDVQDTETNKILQRGNDGPTVGSQNDHTTPKISDSSPRNIILILVDVSGDRNVSNVDNDNEKIWNSLRKKRSFPVDGNLEACETAIYTARLPSSDESVFEDSKEECECKRLLQANIDALLSWARYDMEMTTATVSAMNNSAVPTILEIEGSMIFPRNSWIVNASNENRSYEISEPKNNDTSIKISKENGKTHREGIWDVLEFFSKIRIACFRALLSILDAIEFDRSEKEFSRQDRNISSSNFVASAIDDLKCIKNEKGYLLVAIVEGNELVPIIDDLSNKVTSNDTLMVIVGNCTKGTKTVPFVAEGPGAELLRQTQTIWGLPIVIRNAKSSLSSSTSIENVEINNGFKVISPTSLNVTKQQNSTTKMTSNDIDTSAKIDLGSL